MSTEHLQQDQELEQLRERLEEAESTLEAIRYGEVDALVISGPQGERVFTLKGADQSYRTIVENMGEGAATLAPDGMVLYANARFAQLLELPLERVPGRSLQSFLDGEDAATWEQMQGGLKRWNLEGCLRRSSGSWVPVLLSATVASIDDSPVICLIASDLTEQKRNEEMVASERLARSILEQAGEAIVVCDLAGRILRTNGAARRMRPLAVPGSSFDDVFPLTSGSGERFSVLHAALRRPSRLPVTMPGEGDEEFSLLVSASPLVQNDGTVFSTVVTLTDVTEQKRAEATLKQQATQLERSNADLERFAFAASHDLQEPLRMVNTYAQLLVRSTGQGNPEHQMFAQYIQSGVDRMRTLIKDLLSYSRVIHAPAFDFTDTDMNSVLAIAMANLEVSIQECRAVVAAEDLPPAYGDETQLAVVFQNLISNALKYCDKSPPRISVFGRTDGAVNVYGVRDNGVGIAPQYHEQIFGLFKRLHGREVPGSGIGLAVCKRIIDLHGGTIWVESTAGAGSTFYFELPRPELV